MDDHFLLFRVVRSALGLVVAAFVSGEPPEGEWNPLASGYKSNRFICL